MSSIRENRQGMTLVELLVAMVVAALILQGAVGFFVGQSELVGETESQRVARDISRTAMNVFMADLRRVETGNGVVQATSSVVDVRIPFALGIVCASSGLNTTVSLLPTDSVQLDDAGNGSYAIRNASGTYGGVIDIGVFGAGSPADCTGASPAITVFENKYVRVLAPGAGAVAPGTPALLYDRIRYEFAADAGGLVLKRTVNGGAQEELVGPFDATGTRFRFYGVGAAVASDAPPANFADIRGIEVVLHGLGDRPRRGSGGVTTAPLTASVFFKNRP